MAQTGYTPIQLYYSSTTTNVPLAANLAAGELAINTADGKLFYKDNGGVVRVIAQTSSVTNVASISFGSTGLTPSTATTGAVTVAGTLATTNGGTGLTSFTANGVVYASSTSALTTGSALTFNGTDFATTGSVLLNNAQWYYGKNAASGLVRLLGITAGNVALVGPVDSGPTDVQFSPATTVTNQQWFAGGTEQMRLTSTGLGIGTSSPATKLDVNGSINLSSVGNLTWGGAYGAGIPTIAVPSAGSLGFYPNGSTSGLSMVLNSSGNLGIGTSSPLGRLDCALTNAATNGLYFSLGGGETTRITTNTSTGEMRIGQSNAAAGNYYLTFYTTGNERMRLDTSGNLGLGVTPSAWAGLTSYRSIELGTSAGTGVLGGPNDFQAFANAYYATGWKYAGTGAATSYKQGGGQHIWNTAPSGTAGNAISFTQAMTLDASGNLLVGQTSQTAPGVGNTTTGFAVGGSTGYIAASRASGSVGFFNRNSDGDIINLNSSGVTTYQLGLSSGALTFSNTSERARITSTGSFSVNASTSVSTGTNTLQDSGSSPNTLRLYNNTDSNNATNRFLICDAAASVLRAEIRSNGGLANYQANDVNLSDRREKTNFAPAKDYLDTICAIPVQTFNYIDQSEDDPGLTLGVVAQDVQAVAPELVTESNWGTEDDPKMRLSIYQTDLQYALMKCIQELKAQNDDLRARVAQLEAK